MGYSERCIIAKMDLETVLLKIYNVDEIGLFYDQFLAGLAADPRLQDVSGARGLIPLEKALVKRKKVKVLLEVFQDAQLFSAFYSQQSAPCKSALELLVWYGGLSLDLVEQRLGRKITIINKGSKKFFEPFILKSGFELLLFETSRYHYSFRGVAGVDTKKGIDVFLPEPLREVFRENLPKPAAYTLPPLPRKRKTTFTYCSETTALTEVVRLVEFVGQGHLALKKNGDATVKGLRDLTKMSQLQEFYPSASSKEVERMKAELLSLFFLGISLKKSGLSATPENLLRTLFNRWVETDSFLIIEKLLSHLRISKRDYYYSYTSWNIKKDLHKLLKALPLSKWVSMETLCDYCIVREVNLLEKQVEVIEYRRSAEEGYGSWEDWATLDSAGILPVVSFPVLRAFFFLAASLGLVEIGYDIPMNKSYKCRNHDYLSCYDGLQQVRLTKLGAYVSGKTGKYDASGQVKQAKAVFTLDTSRLLLTMEGDDPIAALTLEKMLKQMGSGRYMLTFESLLKDCHTKDDVQQKITLFRKIVCKKPLGIWSDFFSRALARVNPLTPEPTFKVFQLEQDQELLQLLSSDPDISPLLLKVEGFRIAVKSSDIYKLTSRLRKHGYLISDKSLTV